MDIINNIVFEMNKRWYKKMTIDKLLIDFKALDIDITKGISMEQLVRVFDTFGYRCSIKLYWPNYDLVFDWKYKNNNNRGYVNLFFYYGGIDAKLKVILDEELVDKIKKGNLKNIRRHVYKINMENDDYAEFECSEFWRMTEISCHFNSFFNECKRVNFIYGEGINSQNQYGVITDKKLFGFNTMLFYLSKMCDITDINKSGKSCYIEYDGKEYNFIYCKNYMEIKNICKILKDKYNLYNFEFNGGSYANIFNEVYRIENKEEVLKMSYNDEIDEVIDLYSPSQLIGKLDVKTEWIGYGWDKCKSYTYGLVNARNEKIGVISKFDNLEKWNKELVLENIELGWYLLKPFKWDVLEFDTIFVPCYFVKYLINNGVDFVVLKWVKSKTYYRVEKLVRAIEFLYNEFYDRKKYKMVENIEKYVCEELGEEFNGDEFIEMMDGGFDVELKSIVNQFIGTLNCKYSKNKFAMLIKDSEVTSLYQSLGYKCTPIDILSDLTLVSNDRCDKLDSNSCLIYNFIITIGYTNLMDGIKMVRDKFDVKICNWNTDGFSFYCNEKIERVNTEYYCNSKNIFDFNYKIGDYLFKENMEISDCVNPIYRSRKKKFVKKSVKSFSRIGSMILNGPPGSSKTMGCLKLIDNVICLGYTNKSVENMKLYLDELNVSGTSMTIHRLLGFGVEGKLEHSKKMCINKYDYVFIDEFYTIPPYIMSNLIDLLKRFDGKIVFSGDH